MRGEEEEIREGGGGRDKEGEGRGGRGGGRLRVPGKGKMCGTGVLNIKSKERAPSIRNSQPSSLLRH